MLGKRKPEGKGVSSGQGKKVARTQPPVASKPQKREHKDASPPASGSSTPLAVEHTTGSLTLKQVRVALKALLAQLETIEGEYRLLERVWYKNAAQFKSALWWKAFDGARRPLKRMFGAGVARRTARVCVEAYSAAWAPPAPALSSAQQAQTGAWPSVPKFAPAHTNADAAQIALGELADLQRMLAHIRMRCVKAGDVLAMHLNTPPAPTFAPLVTAILALLASVHAAACTLLDPHTTPHRDSPLSQLKLAFTAPRHPPL